MNSQRLDETSKEQETRSWQTKEEAGKVLKHEDELQDISNMDLAKVQKNKPEGSKEKSQEQTKYQEGSQENKFPIGEMKRQVADKLSELQSKGQEKGEELKEKTQGYFDKALGEFESKQIQKRLQEVNIEPGTKQHIESSQLQGKQVLTDQKKREILDLTQQLTEKVQKLKQTEDQTQPQSYSQDNTQNLSDKSYSQTKSSDSSNQHKEIVSDQSEGGQQETKQKVIQGAQDISGKISEKVEDLTDNLQSEKKKFIENKSETLGKAQEQGQIQKETQYYKERQPIVDQILGRIHAVSDNIHHQVEDFKNVFKVEEGKNQERVPLIDQFTHSIHNVTDKISHGVGALKPKGSSTQPEKREEIHQTQESQLSRKLSGSSQDSSLPQGHSLKQKVQEGLHNITNIFSHSVEAVKSKLTSAKKQKENLEEQQYTERNIHYYKVGEEFREIIAGFSHTVDEAFQEERVEELNKVGIQENPFEPFGEKDIKITPHPHGTERPQDYEEDLGQEYLDFKIQGIKDLHAEGKGNESASQNIEQKTSNEDLATELKGNTSSTDKGVGHEYQDFKTQGSRNEDKSSGVTYPSKTKENIRDSGADIGYKYQGFKTQGFEDMRNEGSKGNEPAFTESRSVIDRAREEIEKVDKLLQSSILNAGKSTEKIESKEPTLIKSQGTITQAYKDLGTQTEGIGSAKNYASDLTRRADEGVDKNDKLLENAIQSAEIDTGKNTSYLTQKVNEDVNRNDMLLNKIIYTGENIQPGETSQSLSTDIYSQGQGQALGSQKFRDITNEVAGSDFSQKSRESLIEKARKDLEYTDKLLENSIREGGHTTSFGIGSEDKENISIPKSSKVGTEKTTFGQSELRNVPQNI